LILISVVPFGGLTLRKWGTTVASPPSPQGRPTDSQSIRRPLAVLAVVAGLLLGAPAAAAQKTVDHTCDTATSRDGCERWYTGSSVTLDWNWSPNATNTTGCQTGTFSSEGRVERSCTVEWSDGPPEFNDVWIGIDRTPPSVVGIQSSRPDDYNGWFNHPVSLAFQGADAVSGIGSCTSLTFAGPEGAGVMVSGTCTDAAGLTSSGSFPINYDATPPPSPSVEAMPGDTKVDLKWTTSPDSRAEVLRVGGEESPTVVYSGSTGAFTDRSVRNERRYRYLVTLIDQAGNRAVGEASTVPTASNLLLPPQNARVKQKADGAPLLVWEPVRGARYYNVQLFRGKRKVLSAWPNEAQFQLKRRWKYRGKEYRLRAGRYCWHVWPGFGERSAQRYGKLLGTKCFRVTR
jgi:hypothetical protein